MTDRNRPAATGQRPFRTRGHRPFRPRRPYAARPAALCAVPVVLLLLAALAAGPAGAAYVLQPGDKVRLSIAELPQSESITTIDIDGRAHFPRLGTFEAAGLTLGEFNDRVGLSAAGKMVTIFSQNGERFQVPLDGTELFAEIVEYRPVYVSGDVREPGRIAFEPGLTVRAAIAAAGGASLLAGLDAGTLAQLPRIQAEGETLALEEAAAVVRLWGIDAALARDADKPLPDRQGLAVEAAVFDGLVRDEQQRIDRLLAGHRQARERLEASLATLDDRIEFLSQNVANQEEAIAIEDADLERARRLHERGLTTTSALSEARRSLLIVSSQLLTVQDSLARFRLERQQLRRELSALETDFERALLRERSRLVVDLLSFGARLEGVDRSLGIRGLTLSSLPSEEDRTVTTTVIRAGADAGGARPVGLEDLLRPGDVLEVDVEEAVETPAGLRAVLGNF